MRLDSFGGAYEYFYDDDLTMVEHWVAAHGLAQEFAEWISADRLGREKNRSVLKIVPWRGCGWAVTGGVWEDEWVEVDLRRVTRERETALPVNNPIARGEAFYTGMRFRYQGEVWVLDCYGVALHSERFSRVRQGALL